MLSEFCQLPDVGAGDDGLPSQHCNHKNHSFAVPEDTENDIATDSDIYHFFFRRGLR